MQQSLGRLQKEGIKGKVADLLCLKLSVDLLEQLVVFRGQFQLR